MITNPQRVHKQSESKHNANSYYLLAKEEYRQSNYLESARLLFKSYQSGSEKAKKLFHSNTPHEFGKSNRVDNKHNLTDDKITSDDCNFCMALRAHAGIGMNRNHERAFKIYSNMLAKDDTRAIVLLAVCYQHGYGVAKDQRKAVELYRIAGTKGDPQGWFKLGVCYDDGIGVTKDKIKAAKLYRKAGEHGIADGWYNLSICYEKGVGVSKNKNKAAEFCQKAGELGTAKGWIRLGYCYQYGIGVPVNKKKAAEYYERAGKEDVPLGWYYLGLCYEDGIGVNKDEKKAAEYYQKAGEDGVPEGLLKLGYFYLKGIGVDKNEKEAAKLYQKVGEEGLATGWLNLGVCYENGFGVPVNQEKAIELYRKAGEQGIAKGWLNLGHCYRYGRGVSANKEKATELYRKAGEEGDPTGWLDLGVCYEQEIGVTKDEQKAAECYRIAGEQGIAKGWLNLGVCYENGRGVPVNPKKATKLYRKAGEEGEPMGWEYLANCYKEGAGVVQDDKQAALYFGATLRRYRDLGDTSGRNTYARAFNSLNSCNSVFTTISLALSGHQFIDSETLKGLMTNNLVSTDQERILRQIKIELEQTHGRIGKQMHTQTMVKSLSTILDNILKTHDHQTDHKLKVLNYSCQLFASVVTNKTIALNNEQSSDILCKLLLIIKKFSALLMDESVNHAYNEFAAAAASAYSPIEALHSDAKNNPAKAINADVKSSPTHLYIPSKVDKEILNLFKLPNSISALESANCTLLSCKFISLATQLAKGTEKEELIKINDAIQTLRVDTTHSVCKKAREHFTTIIAPSALDENEQTDIPKRQEWENTLILANKENDKNRLNRALLNLANDISRRSLSYLDGEYISPNVTMETEEQKNTNKKVYIPKGLAEIYHNIMKLQSHRGDDTEQESYQSILLKIKKIAKAHLDTRNNVGWFSILYYNPTSGLLYQRASTLVEISLEISSPGHDEKIAKCKNKANTKKAKLTL